MAFAKLKNYLRSMGARNFTDIFNAIAQACELYTQSECLNYFRHSGYASI